MSKAVVLLSGGIDSATVAAKVLADGNEVIAISFDYGQRHIRELYFAHKLVKTFGIKEHFVVNVNLAQWGGSLLTNQSIYTQDKPNHTNYVPGRNTVFIAISLSLAEAKGCDSIYLGFNAADIYHPDTQRLYLEAFVNLASLSSKAGIEGKTPKLIAPLMRDDKVSIVHQALQLGVPISETWSCFFEAEDPCGSCSACRLRDFALIKAGRPDLATSKGNSLYIEETQRSTRKFWRFMLRGN